MNIIETGINFKEMKFTQNCKAFTSLSVAYKENAYSSSYLENLILSLRTTLIQGNSSSIELSAHLSGSSFCKGDIFRTGIYGIKCLKKFLLDSQQEENIKKVKQKFPWLFLENYPLMNMVSSSAESDNNAFGLSLGCEAYVSADKSIGGSIKH